MRIGIDCRTILNPGFGEQAGVGHYTYFLVKNLLELDYQNEYVLFFDEKFGKQAALEFVGNRPNTVVREFPFHAYRHLLPFVYSHLLATSFIAREKCDVFHSPDGSLPATYRGKSVITIHDLAVFRHPEWFPSTKLENFSSMRILLPRAVRLASKIIVPSLSTKQDVHEFFRVPDEKVVVIPHGVEKHEVISEEVIIEDLKVKFHLRARYILFVGTIEPRKNLVALIHAFKKLKEEEKFKDVSLAIAGAKGWKYENVFNEIEKVNATDAESVQYLGYISSNDKFSLMKNAAAFVFLSHYEGFGLSVLEAMSMGAPVITSNISSLPEVVGEGGLLINPDNEEEIYNAIKRVLSDEEFRNCLSEAGKHRANEFTWLKTAEQTIEVYKEI